MEFTGKKLLVLGGAGLVGQAICKLAAQEGIKELTICSLFENEAKGFAQEMRETYPHIKVHTYWGNIFVRADFKDTPATQLINDSSNRRVLISDIVDPLNREILSQSSIFKLLEEFEPDIIVDSINTATGIAYQNCYGISKEVSSLLDKKGADLENDIRPAVERLLCTQYLPQLIRHVQIFLQSMVEHKSKFYLKIGTCGTGGMGLNIPYTHSEDKPSQMLLSKSAVAGGHSLLMFLMARTPGSPIIKELKPAAAIAWKRVAYGAVKKKGREVLLENISVTDAVPLKGTLLKTYGNNISYLEENGHPKNLAAPFIDTGENGLFSLGEFEALTEEGQMEFITPEEIAQCAIWEIKGLNTGHDIVAALDNSTMGPTYRAGYMRNGAIKELKNLIRETGVESVAFEQLGPPRLSKLLYEAHLMKLCFGTFEKVLAVKPDVVSKIIEDRILSDEELRSRIVSIGIPILLGSGDRLLRGSHIAIPADVPGKPDIKLEITPEKIDKWAHDGWVDLRKNNFTKWHNRFLSIKEQVNVVPKSDNSSFEAKGRHYWQDDDGRYPISAAKLVSWIFINEEEGVRMKA